MADPLSIATGVVGLITFALSSSVKLYTTVREFQSQSKTARGLKNELSELTAVLQSLLETTTASPGVSFDALRLPLERCGKACIEYGELIARFTSHSTQSRSSVRDWLAQKYLQGDVDDFKCMIAGYKSTINIALANANIRIAVMTPQVLEEYKDLISDTTADLKEHLQQLDDTILRLSSGPSTSEYSEDASDEWQAIMEEKQSTQQGLKICAQLSAQIELLEPAPKEDGKSSYRPSAHHYMRTGLNVTKGSIQAIVTQLRSHEEDVDHRMAAMAATAPNATGTPAELKRLQETKESLQQCIQIISDADQTLASERHNLFEDITLEDDAFNFTVSTVGDLVTARRIDLKGRSRNVGGQISDESFQKAVAVFSNDNLQLNREQLPLHQDQASSVTNTAVGTTEFRSRHGRGVKLSALSENIDVARSSLD